MAGTVTVACKLPHGLILRAFKMVKRPEPVMGGGTREVEVAEQIGDPVTIKGYAVPFGKAASVPVAGGYALTSGVDADFFAAWMEQNKDHDAVKNGLIFAHARIDSATSKATEQAAIRNGLEPIDPNKLPKGIERADRNAA